jgi:hypothetical protein
MRIKKEGFDLEKIVRLILHFLSSHFISKVVLFLQWT